MGVAQTLRSQAALVGEALLLLGESRTAHKNTRKWPQSSRMP